MSLNLPPKSLIRAGAENAALVHDELTKVIAGHPNAATTYRFYEEIDTWLGPWGPRGYPLGYGKKYNLLFTNDRRLNANPTTRQWVWRTTILLQEAIRDFLVELVRRGSIGTISIWGLTEAQLRRVAFDSHPRAYTRAGLATVALTSPGITLHIAAIPGAEFNPFSENFTATIAQALETGGIALPEMMGTTVAAMMPAHSGYLRRAAQRDMDRNLRHMNQSAMLGQLRSRLAAGEYDHIGWLDRLITQLERTQYPDHATARAVAEIIQLARQRRTMVLQNFSVFTADNPEIRTNLPAGAAR